MFIRTDKSWITGTVSIIGFTKKKLKAKSLISKQKVKLFWLVEIKNEKH